MGDVRRGWQDVDRPRRKRTRRTARMHSYGRRYWKSDKLREEEVRKHIQDFNAMANEVLANRMEQCKPDSEVRLPYPWEE